MNTWGKDEGAITRQKTWACVAPMLRADQIQRGLTPREPYMALMKVGKKTASEMMATLEASPNPNQVMTTGSRATLGTG